MDEFADTGTAAYLNEKLPLIILAPVEPPDERLPPRTGRDLRPLPNLHQRVDTTVPRPLFGRRRSNGPQSRYAEAAAVPLENHFSLVFVLLHILWREFMAFDSHRYVSRI
ncbi:hypothetical protein Vadar_016133 [Vaccinium darrowii]|uniref:Uncharacterized protein n=1 Tax=Vaccinium darrowii TaxID=229202 RepID=A0ACB7ZKN9_9ERIC|nr:hypothetical protein Vadar_016133 [Vaccinium darrowii]